MMTLEEIKKEKKLMGYSYRQLAELSGVPLGTVQKILSGRTKAPRHETLIALERVFRKQDIKNSNTYKTHSSVSRDMLREQAPYYGNSEVDEDWPRQGEYTLEDYYALPDEKRVELIDGVFYDMASPSGIHQIIAGVIYAQLLAHATEQGMPCEPMIAPLDVQLDCDEKTMVQPDVIVLCDLSKLKKNKICGAPDLLVEVLSPSTKKKDSVLKYAKYLNAGVREYWMVFPDKRKIVVYSFENDGIPAVYGEKDLVPVGISGGTCSIDFSEIFKRIDRLYPVTTQL